MFGVFMFNKLVVGPHVNQSVSSGLLRLVRLFHGTREEDIHLYCAKGLQCVLQVKKRMAVEDWIMLQELYNFKAFPHFAIKQLSLHGKSLKMYKTLVEALESKQNFPLILKCLSLPIYNKFTTECTDCDKREIVSTYQEVLKTFSALTEEMTECLFKGVLVTPLWKKTGMELLKDLQKYKHSPPAGYNDYIAAAFRHNDSKLGWKLMREFCSRGGILSGKAYHSVMDYFERRSDPPNTEDIMKLIEFFEETNLMPSFDVATRLQNFFEECTRTWVARFSDVNVSGCCSCCATKLRKIKPSEEDMESLKRSILSDVLQSSTAYLNSSPKEIERFKTFLRRCSPYDVVIDGLNVLLRRSPAIRVKVLKKLLNYLKRRGHSVLVIGRKHLENSPELMRALQKTQFFFAADESKDDPFAIYAAVYGGSGTYLVSNDFMTNHYIKVNLTMLNVFRTWQLSSQVLCDKDNNLIFPVHTPVCQSSTDGNIIHVPYSGSYAFYPSGWVCIQQVNANMKKDSEKIWPKVLPSNAEILSPTYRSLGLKLL